MPASPADDNQLKLHMQNGICLSFIVKLRPCHYMKAHVFIKSDGLNILFVAIRVSQVVSKRFLHGSDIVNIDGLLFRSRDLAIAAKCISHIGHIPALHCEDRIIDPGVPVSLLLRHAIQFKLSFGAIPNIFV